MQKFLMAATLAAIAVTSVAPVSAAPMSSSPAFEQLMDSEFDRRGRRPRVPGGSGCDSPRDILEHPECTPA